MNKDDFAQPRLVLVDGSSYLFRAFHGMPKLESSKGEPTGAIKGVISMIQKLHEDYQPSHIAIVFDASGKTFRHEIYADYKANRPPMDDDLRVQIKPLLQLIEAMGYPLLQIEGVEADDVIGTLAQQANLANMSVLISTSDKDLAQLINGNTRLIDTMKMAVTDSENVGARFKVDKLLPEQVIDFLALVGDSSDNIPGIPKVGPKTAAKWLLEYQTLENLLAHQDAIGGKVGESLRAFAHQLPMAKSLATIKCDVALPVDVSHLSMNPVDKATVAALCQRFELTQLRTQLLGQDLQPTPQKPQVSAPKSHWLTDIATVETMINAFDPSQAVLSCKTYKVDDNNDPSQLCIALFDGQNNYIAFLNRHYQAQADLFQTPLITHDLPVLPADAAKRLITFIEAQTFSGYDLNQALKTLRQFSISLSWQDDLLVLAYNLNSVAKNTLPALALRYLEVDLLDDEAWLGKGKKAQSLLEKTAEAIEKQLTEETTVIFALLKKLKPRVLAMPGVAKVYTQIDAPLVAVIDRIEQAGILLDKAELARQSTWLQDQLSTLEEAAYQEAGEAFNLGSPKQLQTILFERLGLPVLKKTPKGQPSTDEEVLQNLAFEHTLPHLILQHRGLAKLQSTYVDKLPRMVAPNGRIHTTYHQAVTSTGRLSSSDPNLQNIPIRSEAGRNIRRAFVAEKGYVLLACDYSQIELRLMAHLSQDAKLLKAFNAGRDIHKETAAEVFHVAESEVDDEMRRRAKAINFGLIYGMSAFGLSRQIGVARKEANDYIERYFARYQGVKRYMQGVVEFARGLGYVETIDGRRLYLPDIDSKNALRKNAAERLAINAPLQGSAADLIKRAMCEVDLLIRKEKKVRLIMQVHDELVFEIAEEVLDIWQPRLCEVMQNVQALSVPLLVSSGVGHNWADAH